MKPNKLIINQSVKLCGHLLPLDERLNNYQFKDLISNNFSINNPIVQRIYKEVLNSPELYFKRTLEGVKVTSI